MLYRCLMLFLLGNLTQMMKKGCAYLRLAPSYFFVCDCSLIVLNKLDSIRHQREREENKIPSPGDGRSFGPLLMMAITDEFSNHPDQLPLDGKYQCLQLPKKTGDEILITPCDTTNKLQYFTQGLVPPTLYPSSHGREMYLYQCQHL